MNTPLLNKPVLLPSPKLCDIILKIKNITMIINNNNIKARYKGWLCRVC